MRWVEGKWSPCYEAGGAAIVKWELIIHIGGEELCITEAEAGALINILRTQINISILNRKT